MVAFSGWHWLVVLIILMIFFGSGRVSAFLSDLGKGFGTARRQLKDLDDDEADKG